MRLTASSSTEQTVHTYLCQEPMEASTHSNHDSQDGRRVIRSSNRSRLLDNIFSMCFFRENVPVTHLSSSRAIIMPNNMWTCILEWSATDPDLRPTNQMGHVSRIENQRQRLMEFGWLELQDEWWEWMQSRDRRAVRGSIGRLESNCIQRCVYDPVETLNN